MPTRPDWQSFVNTACMIIIAIFVVLAYFNGWGQEVSYGAIWRDVETCLERLY